MDSTPSKRSLANYRLLLDRIDNLCNRITEEFSGEISCRAGCSGCCRHLTVFAAEAANLLDAVGKLSAGQRALLAERLSWPESSSCPLLVDDCCAVYSSRPVICRTHGLPLLFESDGRKNMDCCPENFRNTGTLPGSAVINLETLNTALFTINSMFLSETADERLKQKGRFTIADIIRLSEETV